MKTFTVAVVGCGRIAKTHFKSFSNIGNVRVKYACDLIEEKAKYFQDKYDFVENVITDYKIALADAEVEVVYVLTPNYAHYTVTMDALRAGKHVMCEKPITVTYALAKEMKEEADRNGVFLNIGVCNRYQPSVVEIERLNREGKFGKIYHVYCSFRNFRSIPGLGGAFTDKSQSGGGVLIDWGIHFLDLILYVLGGAKIKTLTCDTYSEMAKDMKSYRYTSMWAEDTSDVEHGVNNVDDFITGHIRTDKGTISFNGAWAQNLNQKDMYVDFLGDKGGARLEYCDQFVFCNGETLESTQSQLELPEVLHQAESEDFFACIEKGVKNRNNIDRVLESAKLLDALYRSAELGRELNETDLAEYDQ